MHLSSTLLYARMTWMSEVSGSGMKLVSQNVKGADDVALVAEFGADLQNMLDSLSGYCDK